MLHASVLITQFLREFGSLTLNLYIFRIYKRLLKITLSMNGPERAFVPFSPSDNYVLVNNMSGTSTLEMYAIALLHLSRGLVGLNSTVRGGAMILKCYGELIGLLSFIVDPEVLKRVLKHGAQAVLESPPDLTKWDAVSFFTCVWYSHWSFLQMVTVEGHVQAVLKVLSIF